MGTRYNLNTSISVQGLNRGLLSPKIYMPFATRRKKFTKLMRSTTREIPEARALYWFVDTALIRIMRWWSGKPEAEAYSEASNEKEEPRQAYRNWGQYGEEELCSNICCYIVFMRVLHVLLNLCLPNAIFRG